MFENRNKKRTEIASIGEFGLINKITENIVLKNSSTIKGVGDDAAVIYAENKRLLISTDLLIEGVHFDLMFTPLKHLGYKAAVVNFSDIAAMNGVPKQITIGIAISNRFSVEAIEELYAGISMACDKYQVDLIGGDTTTSLSGLFISVTVIGEADENDIVYRNTAKEGDLICVSGDLGASYMGLQILEREKFVFKNNPEVQPDLSGHDYILERQLKPEARTDIVELFKKLEIKPTSMIDISDGLASEILHICNDSKVGCRLYEEKIPIDIETIKTAESFKIVPLVCALSGGEDYELLFTIKLEDFEKVKTLGQIKIIGHITNADEGINLITKAEQSIPLTTQGWDSFNSKVSEN